MVDLTGQTVLGYRLLGRIGEGGMAVVYKAYQPSLDRVVAIKILPPEYARRSGFAKRFQREARAVAKLKHPHILDVYDFGQEGDLSVIVMRYVEAGTLKDLLHQGPLPLPRISDIVRQLGEALAYAHEHGVIHRDVKPSNILLDKGDWVLLTDFGVAKILEGEADLSGSGVGIGTPDYMSPEQGMGSPADHRSDVYSLGITAYEMLTGKVPFTAETPMAVVMKHIHDPLPLPTAINPAIPENMERVVLKALAKLPEDRFETPTQFGDALAEAVSSSSRSSGAAADRRQLTRDRTAAEAHAGKPPRPPSRSFLVLTGVAALALLAVLSLTFPLNVRLVGDRLELVRPGASFTSPPATRGRLSSDDTATPPPEELTPTSHVDPRSSEVPSRVLALVEDFEDGFAQAFHFHNLFETWRIVDDHGNRVMNIDNSTSEWGPDITINQPITDGEVAFRVKFLRADASLDPASGLVIVSFRATAGRGYVFALDPAVTTAKVNYVDSSGTWRAVEGGSAAIPYDLNVWYSIRLTFRGPDIRAYRDEVLIAQVVDHRATAGDLRLGFGPYTSVQLDEIQIQSFPPSPLPLSSTQRPAEAPLASTAIDIPEPAPIATSEGAWVDNFDAPALNDRWEWIGEDPSHWSLTARPGHLLITTASNSGPGDPANELLQPMPSGDFTIQTRLSYAPTQDFHFAGLVILRNGDNFVRLGELYNAVNGGSMFTLDKKQGGAWSDAFYMEALDQDYVYLQLRRFGSTYDGYVSADGINWTLLGSHTIAFTPTRIGLYTADGRQNTQEIPALFDYFVLDQ